MSAADELDATTAPAGTVGRVASLNRSDGGVPKRFVREARVTRSGMEGDRQRNLKHHGGPDRALCIYSEELIAALREEGHPIAAGSVGENVTVAGIDWRLMTPGTRVALGDVVVELTAYTAPCRTIRRSCEAERFVRISVSLHPGWSRVYARVLVEGLVRSGDAVRLLPAHAE